MSRLVRWLTRCFVTFAVAILALAGTGVVLGERIEEVEPEPIPGWVALLPTSVPTESVEPVPAPAGWPRVVEAGVRVDHASSLILLDPDFRVGSTMMVDVPVRDGRLATVEVDGAMVDFERGVPISILPDGCGETCVLSIRMLDEDGVYLFSDGDLDIETAAVEFVPTEIVRTVTLDPVVDWDPRALVDVCLEGFAHAGEEPFGRFVTLQRRRPDQVGRSQFSLWQGWPVVPDVGGSGCDVEYRLGVQTWGRGRDSGTYGELVVNLVHWGQTPLDDPTILTVTASLAD